MTKIAVFGAGTWGIALARLLAVHGKDVTVWSAIPAELKALSTTHRHPNLPGMELPATMHYTADIAEACAGRDVLLFAVPSPFVRATAKKAAPHIPDGQLIVDVAKGVEDKTLMTMSEIIEDELAKAGRKARVVALSGPTHAEEVARDMPTAIVAACAEEEAAIPAVNAKDVFRAEKVEKEQKFSQPPARYTEASLVKLLEEKGIGRPSTYAPTISTIIERGYVRREKKQLVPTELGFVVTKIMKENFRSSRKNVAERKQ